VKISTVTLNHKANGAEKFRVLVKHKNQAIQSNWSEWRPYSPISNHQITGTINDVSEITAQYYADNSSAYYVTQKLEKSFLLKLI